MFPWRRSCKWQGQVSTHSIDSPIVTSAPVYFDVINKSLSTEQGMEKENYPITYLLFNWITSNMGGGKIRVKYVIRVFLQITLILPVRISLFYVIKNSMKQKIIREKNIQNLLIVKYILFNWSLGTKWEIFYTYNNEILDVFEKVFFVKILWRVKNYLFRPF